jgi:uncharacterized protein YbjQ (UPF0145 family)
LASDTESKNVGIVQGITVRSRSIVGNFFGGIQTIFGGNISIYIQSVRTGADGSLRADGA